VFRLQHVTWALLTASLVVGLAALVRIADPRASSADDITGVIRLPPVVTWTIIALFSLAALVFFVDVARRMRSRRHRDEEEIAAGREDPPKPAWLQALTQILSVVNFVVIVYLLWKNVLPFTDLMALGGGFGAAGGPADERAVDAPPFITWTFAIVALLGGCGALALALWITSSERLAKWWERDDEEPAPPPLVEAVEESLEDLRAEPDARRAIMRCYARFERAAAASGLERRPSHTPMEFMREALGHLPAPPGPVHSLTALFELARFSDRALGRAEHDRALDALDDIKAAIDAERADAIAR
jgi:Domain of unknown function (DUF4129)